MHRSAPHKIQKNSQKVQKASKLTTQLTTKRKLTTKPLKKQQKLKSTFHSTTTSTSSRQFESPQQQQESFFSSVPTLSVFKTPQNTLPTSPTSSLLKSNAFQKTKPTRIFNSMKRAYQEQSYESPQAKLVSHDLPPLGDSIKLKNSNDDWELCYDGALGRTLIYLKKMSITSLILSVVSFPFIVTFPSETISTVGKWVLAGSTVTMGVGTTWFTNVFCSAYVCKAFVSKKHPNIIEFTTAGFTGKYDAFRFDVTEGTTNNVTRPLTSFKHLATDRHFFVAPNLIAHPVWGMILPHLFNVEGDEEAEDATVAAQQQRDLADQSRVEVQGGEQTQPQVVEKQTSVVAEQPPAVDAQDKTNESVADNGDIAEETPVKTEAIEAKIETPVVAETPAVTKPEQKVVDAAVNSETAKVEAKVEKIIKDSIPAPPQVPAQKQ
jgi:hypothetical protein